jgi:hypothetical protein
MSSSSKTPDGAGAAPWFGWIEVERSWRGIDEAAWQGVVRSLPGLAPHPRLSARAGINPVTKQPMTSTARPADPGHALVVDGDRVVGEMKLVRNGPWEIRVRGDRSLVRPIAVEVASRLGGRFLEMP